MQNRYLTEADFRQVRDFGSKINSTFGFLSAHFRPLGRCVLYLVLPVALLAGIAIGLMQVNLQGRLNSLANTAPGERPDFAAIFSSSGSVMSTALIGSLGSVLAYLVVAATVAGYIRVRLALPPEEEVQPSQVWVVVRRDLPLMVAYLLLLGVLLVIAFALFAVPGIWLSIPATLFFTVFVFEEGGFSATLNRSIYLIKHNWWATLGLVFVMSIIQGFMNFVFQVPQFVVLGARGLHVGGLGSDSMLLVTQCFSAIGQIILYVPGLVALAFQYFNLVEKKDGLGLRSLVSQLGQAPAPVVNQAYRPDEEGEY